MLDYLNQMVETLKNLSLEMKLLIGVCLLVLVGALFYKYRTPEVEESFFAEDHHLDDEQAPEGQEDNEHEDHVHGDSTEHAPPAGDLGAEPDHAAPVQEEDPKVDGFTDVVEAFDGDAPAFESFSCEHEHEEKEEKTA